MKIEFRRMKKSMKIRVSTVLVAVVICCVAATSGEKSEPRFKNLKVLPKSISSKDLQGIMVDDFQDGLGVTCGFCHANAKDGHGLDFGSDQKPEKEIARAMMRMTIRLNRKYF